MVNNEFDFDVDLCGNNFKSCFARSMTVNSQYKQKTTGVRQLQPKDSPPGKNKGSSEENELNQEPASNESPNVTRFVKHNNKIAEDSRRFSCPSATNSRRESLCNRPLPNLPIENIMFQSQIDTLQWQLKQTEASREMYRAVMKQVVAFLERAHKSLEILGTRMSCPHGSVQRSRSEHYVSSGTDTIKSIGSISQYVDSTWKPPRKIELSPDEIPPEKLSQEAFRLLRTAQSILNTREPDLANISKINEPEDDINFISQLAKEFPQETKSRPSTFSLSPKLLIPEKEPALIPKITRKLSLYSNGDSIHSINEEESDGRNNFVSLDSNITLSNGKKRFVERHPSDSKSSSEKSVSPPVSSIGSTEDESGFSSMTSFQEVGLPVSRSSLNEETLTKESLLRSMLHDNYSEDLYSLQDYKFSDNYNSANNTKYESPIHAQRLWTKSNTIVHKRSSSTPVEGKSIDKLNMRVLWV